jgi:hypothetical protein
MQKEMRVRGIDQDLWDKFQKKCKKEFGKEWGRLPNEDSPIQSGPAYVINKLIEMFLDGKVCVFAYDDNKKTIIIRESVKQLLDIQRKNPFGSFTEDQMFSKIEEVGLKKFRKCFGQRTLDDYGNLIKRQFCKPVDLPYSEPRFYISIRSLREHTNLFPEINMFG